MEVEMVASLAAAERDGREYIRNPQTYRTPHTTLYLFPDPALTWGVWKLAVRAMCVFNIVYYDVAYAFIINLGPFNESVGSGALIGDLNEQITGLI